MNSTARKVKRPNGMMPDDLKGRLKAFVPRPAEAKIKTLAELPALAGTSPA